MGQGYSGEYQKSRRELARCAKLTPDTIRLLRAMGHTVNEKKSMGAIQSIMIMADGNMHGGADPRRSTSAAMGF